MSKKETNQQDYVFGTWYPIESAPRKYDEFVEVYGNRLRKYSALIGRPDVRDSQGIMTNIGCVYECFFSDGKWIYPTHPSIKRMGHDKDWVEFVNPTHWMPSPPLPNV